MASTEKRNISITLRRTGGPYGDETSSYDVTFSPSDMTVRELIAYVVSNSNLGSEKNGWWGRFYCMTHRTDPVGDFLEYRDGEMFLPKYSYLSEKAQRANDEKAKKLLSEILDKRITGLKAHGGWGAMDYRVWVED
jgi:hypothetical protein